MPTDAASKLADSYDVVIIGAGPAGSAMAMHLLARGRSPLIVEKDAFPRHHIGESLTGECANLLAELGLSDYMANAGFPIKRGVSVSGVSERSRFWVPVEGMTAQGTRTPATTWQVRRDEFDAKLLETARERGAGFIRARCEGVDFEDGRVSGVRLADADGSTRLVGATTLADCSGQQTFLGQQKLTSPKCRTGYENQVAFYAQLSGMGRDTSPNDGSTHIFYGKYHHWAWAIPLSDTLTSVGVVIPKELLGKDRTSLGTVFRQTLRSINPELAARSAGAIVESDIRTTSNYSYHIENFTGPGYLCVGDSHRFLDPIFSFGVLIALQEAKLAADVLDRFLDAPASAGLALFTEYARRVDRAQTVVEYVIRTFWDYPLVFLKLAHFSNRDDIAEIFSGRLYSDTVETIPAVGIMRDLLAGSGKMTA